MNRFFSHFFDHAIEFTTGTYKELVTPPQFRDCNCSAWTSQTPEDFFRISEIPPQIKMRSALLLESVGHTYRFTFPSAYQSPHKANNTVHGLAEIHPPGEARAALIFLHGYSMHSFTPLRMMARGAYESGMDIYYLTFPYHMRRAPSGTWSGQYAMSADIEHTILSFRQAVLDLRSLITWIEVERNQPVAIAGLSLGAITCSMTSVVDKRPFALIALLGGGHLADIIYAGYSFRMIRRELLQHGIGQDELRKQWSFMSPANYESSLPPERTLLLAGKYDPIITPENVNTLWETWYRPRLYWYPCGHASLAYYTFQVSAEMARFLRDWLN